MGNSYKEIRNTGGGGLENKDKGQTGTQNRTKKGHDRNASFSVVETKNSSDLDSGRRPELKSEDFSFLPKGLAR